ncbi:MAG: DUF5615 family PIN-like protein [SAR324 cluster bacterium]|nr:DUF5615 family PIN-like protein [SAR324 cluster bacterium]
MKFTDIKLLTDENISPRVANFFRQQGFDVLDVKDKGWCGMEDEELLERAFSEKRFVVTHDSDFGTLTVNEGKSCYGILYLRLKTLNPNFVIQVCKNFLQLNYEFTPGLIVVLENNRVRIREIK